MAKKQEFSLLWAAIGMGTGTAIGLATKNPYVVIGSVVILGYLFGKYIPD